MKNGAAGIEEEISKREDCQAVLIVCRVDRNLKKT